MKKTILALALTFAPFIGKSQDSIPQTNETIIFEVSETQKLVQEIIELIQQPELKNFGGVFGGGTPGKNNYRQYYIDLKFAGEEFEGLPSRLTLKKQSSHQDTMNEIVFTEVNGEYGTFIDGSIDQVESTTILTEEIPWTTTKKSLDALKHQKTYEKALKDLRNMMRYHVNRVRAKKEESL